MNEELKMKIRERKRDDCFEILPAVRFENNRRIITAAELRGQLRQLGYRTAKHRIVLTVAFLLFVY
jgi:hypothetical protein